jgi:hypothetical protein
MRRAVDHFEVAQRIVQLVSVLVVDTFVYVQQAPEMLLHDPAMFKHFTPYTWRYDTIAPNKPASTISPRSSQRAPCPPTLPVHSAETMR